MKTRIIQDEPEPGGAGHAPEAPRRRTNIAGHMGRWSAQHRKTAIFGWFAFVILSFAIGTMKGTTQIDPATSGVGESGRAERILDDGFKQPATESVLIQSETLTTDDPAFQAAIEDVVVVVGTDALEALLPNESAAGGG